MSWVDVLVVLLALVAGVSGWRHGMAVALLSFVGVIGGAILGVQLAPLLAANLEAKNTQVVVSIVVVVVLVALGETTGVYFGRHIRDRINGERTLTIDSALGSVLQAATVVVAAWLVALPLATASVPGLAAGVRGSSVLRAVDEVMPAPARQLPADLRQVLDSSGFPDVLSPFAPTPITAGRAAGSRAGQQRRGAGRREQRPEDPRQGAVVQPAAGGHRVRHRTGAGDDERARRRGDGRDERGGHQQPRAHPGDVGAP